MLGLLLVPGACSLFADALGDCGTLGMSERRCAAIIDQAITGSDVHAAEVVDVDLRAPVDDGPNLGGHPVAVVRLHLASGDVVEHEVWCIGVGTQYLAWCTDDPEIELRFGANHDVPCSGPAPDGCATPIALDPEAVAAARPLRVAVLDVPAAVGHHEVALGSAWLANGYLEEAAFTLADRAPDGVEIPGGIRLDVRPADPSRPPLGNVFERGIVDGTEEVTAWLVFDVVAAPDGAVVQIRDVVVR